MRFRAQAYFFGRVLLRLYHSSDTSHQIEDVPVPADSTIAWAKSAETADFVTSGPFWHAFGIWCFTDHGHTVNTNHGRHELKEGD
jgi:hypothetical protein